MRAFAAFIVVLIIGGAIAWGAYDAGVMQGAAQGVTQFVAPAGAPGTVPVVTYYGHPYGWGYGFNPFGFLFPLLGLFLFFGVMRALIGGGRGWGHRGWSSDGQPSVPGRFEEWHKRSHGEGSSTDRPAPPRQ